MDLACSKSIVSKDVLFREEDMIESDPNKVHSAQKNEQVEKNEQMNQGITLEVEKHAENSSSAQDSVATP